MSTRTMGPASGWHWLWSAVNLGSGNPRAIFGGAALLLLVVVAVTIILSIGLALLGLGDDPQSGMLLSVVITIPLMALMSALMVGYLRVIDAVEHGRPASALGIFSGFGDRQGWLRATGFLLVLALLQNLILGGVVMLVAPEAAQWYMENLGQANMSEPAALPSGFGRAFAVVLVLGMLVYGVQAVGLGQIALRGRGIGGALADGFAGALRNVLPLVVLMLLGVAVAIVLSLVVGVLVLVFAALGAGGGGAAMAIAAIIGIPLYLLFLVALTVVACGVMYAMWRDVSGDGGSAPGDDQHQVAA